MANINYKKILLKVSKLCALGLLMGALGGFLGGCFSRLLSFVTNVREAVSWIVFLLPLGGIGTVILYRVFRMENYGGTNEIIQRFEDKRPMRVIAAPLIFISTAITHLFGGSAGREGAAIQLGGTVASALSNALHLKGNESTAFILSGMSAAFSGVFGMPLTATFFVLEFKLTAKAVSMAILPCFISAVIAQRVSSLMGVAEEAFYLSNITRFTFHAVVKIFILAIGLSVLAKVMCYSFRGLERWTKKVISNSWLRSALGATLIVALTAIVGDMRYNGSGIGMAIRAVEGSADWFDFILKIIFTAVTLASGFKGGEIIPTFCIGATFGCVLGSVLGLDAGFSAALGLVGLFCCATNSPVSSIFLGVELFGLTALPYYLLICLILLPLSAKKGLFGNRFFTPKSFIKSNT